MVNSKSLSEEDVEEFINKLKAAGTRPLRCSSLERVLTLCAALIDVDKKVDIVQFFGLRLEDTTELPQSTLDALTLLIAPLLRSSSHLLVTSILTSFLPFYLPLLPLNPTSHLRLALHQFLPAGLEKLNDPKERTHKAAAVSVAILGKKSYEAEPTVANGSAPKGKEKESIGAMWERLLKESLVGKHWRGKVEALKMLQGMREDSSFKLPLKPWLATLVDLLEDGDGNVRDQARETTVALLSPSSTPPAARAELKKLMLTRGVRKTISDNIIARVLGGGLAAQTPAAETPLEGSQNGETSIRSGTATPLPDEVEVVYVADGRDLEAEFSTMTPFFEGKETEQNWLPREKAVVRIRGLLRGQAFQKYPDHFVNGLRTVLEGLGKTLMSLRTTVSQQSCAVTFELAEYLRTAFDPCVEALLPILGKMAGFTKKITAEKSQRALTAIITYTTPHPRHFIAHIMSGMNEKNVQTRQFCTTHLKTFLNVHAARHRHAIESTPGGVEQLETAVKKALTDVNPQVRESARAAFWSYEAVWPSRALPIQEGMDGVARKQLEKADPRGESASASLAKPPLIQKRAPSAMSAILAEKRKAKAAEAAAGRLGEETSRAVSSPVPQSPSLAQGVPPLSPFVHAARKSMPVQAVHSPQSPASPSMNRSSSSSNVSPTMKKTSSLPRTMSSPLSERSTSATSPKAKPTVPTLDSRSRSSSLASSRGSQSNRDSPLRQGTLPQGLRSPASSTSTSVLGQHTLKTPTLSRTPLPHAPHSPSPSEAGLMDWGQASSTPAEDALTSQAAQAVSAAQQLLDFADDDQLIPVTPMKPSNGNGAHPYKTPLNGHGKKIWEDSPRGEGMSPLILNRLKERKHERGWWTARQKLLDKATSLKPSIPANSGSSVIQADVEALRSGQPDLRNLQKLALFSSSHHISLPEEGDDDDIVEERRVWQDGKLFEKIFDALMSYLDPSRPAKELEQALVLLWELVQNQWVMFEDHDIALCDALFRLRACQSSSVMESTNSLISLLTEVSDPLFFLSVIRGALDRYIASHPDTPSSSSTSTLGSSTSTNGQAGLTAQKARASGYLFGLNAIGMCILRMPKEVVEVEAARLSSLIIDAVNSPILSARQAAHTLVLAIQCVLADSQKTLSLLGNLDQGHKNLATYLMEKHGLWKIPESVKASDEHDRKELVMGEMVGLLGRGARESGH
ncbi:hypothetical protein P7C73_g5453, partial [Tremellales sp. Uapishka_1]